MALVLVALAAVDWRRWRLGLDRMQLALVVACLLSAGALLSLEIGRPWHLAWWDYHAFLLAGFAAAIYAVLTGHRRSRTLHDVLDGVFASDPMAHISRGYSKTLRALIAAVEARDAHTHGHSARVAELSVSIGLRMGLRPAALRALAEGPTCTTSARSASPTTSSTSPAPSATTSGPGSRSTRSSAPTSSGGPCGTSRPSAGPFDPRCLDAFLALMAERGHRPGGRVDEVVPADASCH